MVRKPASMYRKVKRAYTRREYMGGVPGSQVIRYDMGNLQVADGFPVTASLLAMEPCQIRHTALEAARITANKLLTNLIGVPGYYMKLRVYPFQVLRENKQATGAGADRVSSGMRHAFGRTVGTAARLKAGQKVFTISTYPQNFKHAKEALRKIGHKLPTPTSIVIDKGAELL